MVFLFMTRSFILLATIFLLSVLPYVISDTTEISFDWNAVGAEVCSCDWRKNSDAECKCSLAEASVRPLKTMQVTYNFQPDFQTRRNKFDQLRWLKRKKMIWIYKKNYAK